MRNGFTLIELAIVLVIVGLLSGGILAGRDLIDAAKLRKVGSKANEYITAAQAFRAAYGQLPGDFSKATPIWGALAGPVSYGVDPAGFLAATLPNSCQVLTSTGTQASTATCNGNGNDLIRSCDQLQDSTSGQPQYNICLQQSNGPGSVDYSNWPRYERCGFWKHLANAGMIAGQYTGNCSDPSGVRSGIDAPATPYGGSSFYLPFAVEGSAFFSNYSNSGAGIVTTQGRLTSNDNVIGTCASASGSSYSPCGRLLSSQQAFSLDSKWDDGMPGVGKVQTITTDVTTSAIARKCIVASPMGASINIHNTTYDLLAAQNTPNCNLIFVF